MKKVLESKKTLVSLFLVIVLFPENSGSIFPSAPLDSISENFVFITTLLIGYKIFKQESRNFFLIYFLLLFLIKIVLITQPTPMWSMCYQDDAAERTYRHSYIDNKYKCEKQYQFNTSEYTTYKNFIDYKSLIDWEWKGANASNFDLGFFNSKKFNHQGNGDFNRNWLSFDLLLQKKFDNIQKFEIVYVGSVKVFKDEKEIYSGENYLEIQSSLIENVENSNIKIFYKFNKKDPIYNLDSYPLGYPDERYAHLQILDSTGSILQNKKSFSVVVLEFMYISVVLFSTYRYRRFVLGIFSDRKTLILILFLTALAMYPKLLELFPVFFIVDTFTVFLYITLFTYFYFNKLKPVETFLIIFLATYLLLDLEFKILDEYIRPGGSDSLTYEYFSRLMLENNFFQGGESVYNYSPGVRYFVFFSHIFFGEKLKFFYIFLQALTVFLFSTDKNYLIRKDNVFYYLGFIYLTSNAVTRIYLTGMSEIYSLLLIVLFYKLKNSKYENWNLLGILLALVLITRPILLLGIILIVIYEKEKRIIFPFISLTLLPLLHNIYFGREWVLFTKDWKTQGPLLGNEFLIQNILKQIGNNISRNFNYLVMNPFSENIYMRTGRLLPFVLSLAFLLICFYLFKNINTKNILNIFLLFLPIALFVGPFVVYDPIYFYPRFLLVPHVIFIYYCMEYKSSLSEV